MVVRASWFMKSMRMIGFLAPRLYELRHTLQDVSFGIGSRASVIADIGRTFLRVNPLEDSANHFSSFHKIEV
jgi:hypothetical protein